MPGHKTWAIGEEVLAADFGPFVSDQIVAVYASAAARATGWATPPVGAMSYLTDVQQLHVFNGTAWCCLTPVSAFIQTTGTTTSAAYTDLSSGAGPAVSIQTAGKALVTVGANLSNITVGFGAMMSYNGLGVSSYGASDDNAIAVNSVASGQNYQMAYTSLATGLTPGVTIFHARYRALGGTASILRRFISAVAVP